MKASAISESLNHGSGFFPRNRRAAALLAFGSILWMANLLPIQRAMLICECNAVVSETRWSQLSQVSGRPELASPTIQWVSFSHALSGDALRQLKLRIGLHRQVSVTELQKELERLTDPKPSDSLRQPRLHKERWQVQVAEHTLARFRLDCERRGVSIAETTQSSPFRLASTSSGPTTSEDQAIMDALSRSLADAIQALALAEADQRNVLQPSGGPLAVTGAPIFTVQGSRPSWSNALVLLILAVGICWFGCGWALRQHSTPERARFRRKRPVRRDAKKIYNQWMHRLGIPYLGAIHVSAQEVLVVDDPVPAEASVADSELRRARSMNRWHRIARWSDGILMLWVVCFVFRYFVDPMWRELLFRAPLAAFSCVLSGI